MNVVLWILQSVLALLYFAGGTYKLFSGAELASQVSAIPPVGWILLGAFEIACAVLLVVPASVKWTSAPTAVAAAALAVETLALAALYATYSLSVTAENPMVWALAMGLLVATVAYGRYAVKRIA
jgi:hypothetical protein